MIIVISVLVFATVVLSANYLMQPRQEVVRRRILEGAPSETLEPRQASSEGRGRRLIRPLLDGIGNRVSRLLPQNLVASLEHMLVEAGQPISLLNFVTLWSLFAGGSLTLAGLFLVRGAGGLGIVLAVCTAALGVGAPYILLRRRARRRRRQIERALPDTLDLLLTSVEAGLGVDAAFALVTEKSQGPVAEVFTEYLKQVGLGRSRRDALSDIADRTGSDGLRRLSATVSQSWEVGASMGDVLRLQASELRVQRRRKAEEVAQRAPFWMTIPLVLCFLPAMACVVVVPSIIRLVDLVNGGFGS
jgi:tight adherence protein C